MSTAHLEELLIVVFGAPGFLLFAWAIVARQFRGSSNGNFGFVDPSDPPHTEPAPHPARWKSRIAFTVIIAVFLLVSVCPVVLTLVMVYNGENALKNQHFGIHQVVRNR